MVAEYSVTYCMVAGLEHGRYLTIHTLKVHSQVPLHTKKTFQVFIVIEATKNDHR